MLRCLYTLWAVLRFALVDISKDKGAAQTERSDRLQDGAQRQTELRQSVSIIRIIKFFQEFKFTFLPPDSD